MSSRGYGKFNVAGTIHYATRLSWADANGGSFPVGMFACHTCDNPACVNPAHIWPGTNQQNVSDAGAKRRHHMSRRDACKNGHAFTTENTLVSPTKAGGTYRRCRACGRKNAHRKG